GAMPCLVIQRVYQRIASIVTGASRHPPARRRSTQSTSPPPAHTQGIQMEGRRSKYAPHWSILPSPSVSRVSRLAARRKSSHVQASLGYGIPDRSNRSLLYTTTSGVYPLGRAYTALPRLKTDNTVWSRHPISTPARAR